VTRNPCVFSAIFGLSFFYIFKHKKKLFDNIYKRKSEKMTFQLLSIAGVTCFGIWSLIKLDEYDEKFQKKLAKRLERERNDKFEKTKTMITNSSNQTNNTSESSKLKYTEMLESCLRGYLTTERKLEIIEFVENLN
jgi:hypothetical protein